MATKKNELAVVENYDLKVFDDEILEAFKEELDGLGSVSFDYIKMPSSGSIVFEVPGDDPENPDIEKTLKGVIVYHHPINTYWESNEMSGGTAPDCQSYNGKTGLNRNTGEVTTCATCPHNLFRADGSGKDCKNGHRIYLLREGIPMPIVLTLPPTSLRPLKDYIFKRLLLRKRTPATVVTEISLRKEKNRDGIAYAEAQFKNLGDLNESQVKMADNMRNYIKDLVTSMPVIVDEQLSDVPPAPPEPRKKPNLDVEYEDDPFHEVPPPTEAPPMEEVPLPEEPPAPRRRAKAAAPADDDDFEEIG